MTTDLIFNSANSDRPQTVTICIFADYVLEDSEFFNVTLTTTDSNAILVPNSATVTIEDVDGKVTGVAPIMQQIHYPPTPTSRDYSWIQLPRVVLCG